MATKKVPIQDEFNWQLNIKDRVTSAVLAGLTPAKGDRYILNDGANINQIAIYNGSTWDYLVATEGFITWVDDENKYYKFDGSIWTEACFPNDGTVNPNNLLYNVNFDITDGAPSFPPWSGGPQWTQEPTLVKVGNRSVKGIRDGSNISLWQDIRNNYGHNEVYWDGRTITFSCWVWCATADRARINIIDNSDFWYSSYHTGDSTWQLLKVTRTLVGYVHELDLLVDTGAATAYFSGPMCTEGSYLFAFSNSPIGTTGAVGTTGATGTTGAVGTTGAAGADGTTGAVGTTGAAGADGTTGAVGTTGAAGADGTTGAVGEVYNLTFTAGNLTAGILTVTHNLSQQYPLVIVSDNNNKVILPDEITCSSTSVLAIDLSSYGAIAGNWHVTCANGGPQGTTGATGTTGAAPAITYSRSFVINNPTSSSDLPIWRVPANITITAVHLLCHGAAIVGQLWEYDANGLNGSSVDTSDITGVVDTNVNDDGTLSNPGIASGNYLGWVSSSASVGATYAIISFDYTID
jgi:hypothetical protein